MSELERLAALERAATPGPWEVYERPGYAYCHVKAGKEAIVFTGRNEDCEFIVAAVAHLRAALNEPKP